MAEMRIDDIKPNSKKYHHEQANLPQERTKPEPIVKKEDIIRTKESVGKRILKTFIKNDVQDIKTYILQDVILPGIRDGLLDMVLAFFGEKNRRSSGYNYNGGNVFNYRGCYPDNRASSNNSSNQNNNNRDGKIRWQDVVIRDSRVASDVVEAMRDRIREFGEASVADLLHYLNVDSDYMDEQWGWTSENDIGMKRAGYEGFVIDAARERPLNRR